MASHVNLKFAEDKKRMFIGYTHPDDDDESQEIWITFVMTATGPRAYTYSSKDGEGMDYKMSHKDSPPDPRTLPLEILKSVSIRVMESTGGLWWSSALVVWMDKFGVPEATDRHRSLQRRASSQMPREMDLTTVNPTEAAKDSKMMKTPREKNSEEKTKSLSNTAGDGEGKDERTSLKSKKREMTPETDEEDNEATKKKKSKKTSTLSISGDNAMNDVGCETENEEMDDMVGSVWSDSEDISTDDINDQPGKLSDQEILEIFHGLNQVYSKKLLHSVAERTKDWFKLTMPIPVDIISRAREDSKTVCAAIEDMWSVPDIRTFIKAHKTTEKKVEEKELFDEQTWDEIAALLRDYLAD